jgi:hypothetical protein
MKRIFVVLLLLLFAPWGVDLWADGQTPKNRRAGSGRKQPESRTVPQTKSSAVTADDGNMADLKETLDWLNGAFFELARKDYVDSFNGWCGGGALHEKNVFEPIDFDGCTLKFKISWSRESVHVRELDVDEWIVPLSSIDPLGIKIFNGYGVELSTTNSENKIIRKYTHQLQSSACSDLNANTIQRWEQNKINLLPHVLDLHFTGEKLHTMREYAPRVKRAILHAVKLCGGKVAPF